MVSFNSTDYLINGDFVIGMQGVCLSSDTKPTNVPNGSILVEMDTKKIYIFDADNSQWREW